MPGIWWNDFLLCVDLLKCGFPSTCRYEPGGEEVPASRLLAEGLTRRKRARDMRPPGAAAAATASFKRAAAGAAASRASIQPSAVAPPGGTAASESAALSRLQQRGLTGTGGGGAGGSSGDGESDIPSVLAPRRPAGIKLRGATGRPASMHVDDYQRGGSMPASGGPTPAQGMMAPPASRPALPTPLPVASMQLQSYDSDSLYSDLFTPKPSAQKQSVDVFSISGSFGRAVQAAPVAVQAVQPPPQQQQAPPQMVFQQPPVQQAPQALQQAPQQPQAYQQQAAPPPQQQQQTPAAPPGGDIMQQLLVGERPPAAPPLPSPPSPPLQPLSLIASPLLTAPPACMHSCSTHYPLAPFISPSPPCPHTSQATL